MQFFLLIAILPCIWASFENEKIYCPDDVECPFGKTCCATTESRQKYQCCDLPEDERLNKKLIPGVSSIGGISESENNFFSLDSCNGTVCPADFCCEGITDASCCDLHSCCPANWKCCGDEHGPTWCCAQKDRCHVNYGYCKAGASALSSAIVALSLVLLLTTIKYIF